MVSTNAAFYMNEGLEPQTPERASTRPFRFVISRRNNTLTFGPTTLTLILKGLLTASKIFGGGSMRTRTVAIVVAVLLAVSFSGMAFAQNLGQGAPTILQEQLGKAKLMKFEGTVMSHDVACHCIVVKTGKGNLTLQDDYAKFNEEYDRAKGLKIGSKISGTYKTANYINYALEIHAAE
jgi:hypothetical protein